MTAVQAGDQACVRPLQACRALSVLWGIPRRFFALPGIPPPPHPAEFRTRVENRAPRLKLVRMQVLGLGERSSEDAPNPLGWGAGLEVFRRPASGGPSFGSGTRIKCVSFGVETAFHLLALATHEFGQLKL